MTSFQEIFETAHSFYGIPYREKTVPFPNFDTLIRQHAGMIPEQILLHDGSESLSYGDLWSIIRGSIAASRSSSVDKLQKFRITGTLVNYAELLILWSVGTALQFEFRNDEEVSESLTLTDLSSRRISENKEIPVPYITPDKTLCRWTSPIFGDVNFSHYNIMAAAQSLGAALELHRPGEAVIPRCPASLSVLMLMFLAPLYYGKTIRIADLSADQCLEEIRSGRAAYCFCPDPLSEEKDGDNSAHSPLRGACFLRSGWQKQSGPSPEFIKYIQNEDHFFGMGPLRSSSGEMIRIQAMEAHPDHADGRRFRGPALFHEFCGNADEKSFSAHFSEDGFYLV